MSLPLSSMPFFMLPFIHCARAIARRSYTVLPSLVFIHTVFSKPDELSDSRQPGLLSQARLVGNSPDFLCSDTKPIQAILSQTEHVSSYEQSIIMNSL